MIDELHLMVTPNNTLFALGKFLSPGQKSAMLRKRNNTPDCVLMEFLVETVSSSGVIHTFEQKDTSLKKARVQFLKKPNVSL